MERKLLKKLHRLGDIMNNESEFPMTVIRWYLVPPVYRWYFKPLYKAMAAVLPEAEIDFLLKLKNDRLTKKQLRERVGGPDETFDDLFNSLITRKAVLWSEARQDGEEVFRIAPMMLGWMELSCSDGNITPDKEAFSRELTKFFNRVKLMNFFGVRNVINQIFFGLGPMSGIARLPLKTETEEQIKIQVGQSLDIPEARIYSTGSVNNLIEKYGNDDQIAVTKCLCRQHWALEGEPCRLDLPLETHLWIGPFADHVVKYGYGRRVSKEEAYEITRTVRDKGGVHEIMHTRMDVNQEPGLSVCNCCWDCCTALGNYNRGLTPLALKAYYRAVIADETRCTNCGKCVEFCPVSAMQLKNGRLWHDPGLCIGCGQCEYQCPEDAVSLVPDERVVKLGLLKKSKRKPAFQ